MGSKTVQFREILISFLGIMFLTGSYHFSPNVTNWLSSCKNAKDKHTHKHTHTHTHTHTQTDTQTHT